MEIITKTEGNKATMEISGWLDTQTAPQLGEALSGLEDSITSLVFDFTNLEYISSAGLRQVIVACQLPVWEFLRHWKSRRTGGRPFGSIMVTRIGTMVLSPSGCSGAI